MARDRELAALVHSAQEALNNFPDTPVALPWSHIALDQIAGRHAALIPQEERGELAVGPLLLSVQPSRIRSTGLGRPERADGDAAGTRTRGNTDGEPHAGRPVDDGHRVRV